MPSNSTGTISVVVPVIGAAAFSWSNADDLAALSQIPTGGTALTLPSDPSDGDTYAWADVDGSCSSSNPITIEAPEGTTIRGTSSLALTSAFAAGRVRFSAKTDAWAVESLTSTAASGSVTLVGPDVTGSGPASAVSARLGYPVSNVAGSGTSTLARNRLQSIIVTGAGATVNLPSAPVSGDVVNVILAFTGAGASTTVTNGGGAANLEPPLAIGTFAASVSLLDAGGVYAYQFDGPSTQWVLLTSNSTLPTFKGPLTPPDNGSWSEPAWFIDPVGGNNTNQGTTQAAPLKTKAELIRRWGTTRPVLKQATTIHYLNSDTDNTDPGIFEPTLEGGSLQHTSPLPAAGFTGTLNVVTAKSHSGNNALQASFTSTTGAIASFMMLVNSTRGNSRAFAMRTLTGGQWLISQPCTPYTGGLSILPTLVDTWASGDEITGYVLTIVNLQRIGGKMGPASAFDSWHQCTQITLATPGETVSSLNEVQVDAGCFPYFIEATVQMGFQLFANTALTAFNNAVLVSSELSIKGDLQGGLQDSSVNIFAGAIVGTYSTNVDFLISGVEIGFDVIVSAFAPTFRDCVFEGGIYLDDAPNSTGQIFLYGLCGGGGAAGFVLYGSQTVNVYNGTLFVNSVGGGTPTFEQQLPTSGGLALLGKTTAYSMVTSAGSTAIHNLALTAAALDASAGATGFGGTATNLAGASITNAAQP